MPAGCCARAASDHVAAAPPSNLMNSRRFTASLAPRIAPTISRGRASWQIGRLRPRWDKSDKAQSEHILSGAAQESAFSLQHDREKACPGLDQKWVPVTRLREARFGGRRQVG